MAQKTYAQRKRASMEYRKEYFKRNPGLFGSVWFCAYCGKALYKESSVAVDHIMPLNHVAGLNIGLNLVSSCGDCNGAKSDKVDERVAIGYGMKGLHSVIFGIQKVLVLAFILVWTILLKGVRLLFSGMILPYKNTSLKTKLIVTFGYLILINLILDKLGII